jgi:hypothetical protein
MYPDSAAAPAITGTVAEMALRATAPAIIPPPRVAVVPSTAEAVAPRYPRNSACWAANRAGIAMAGPGKPRRAAALPAKKTSAPIMPYIQVSERKRDRKTNWSTAV